MVGTFLTKQANLRSDLTANILPFSSEEDVERESAQKDKNAEA